MTRPLRNLQYSDPRAYYHALAKEQKGELHLAGTPWIAGLWACDIGDADYDGFNKTLTVCFILVQQHGLLGETKDISPTTALYANGSVDFQGCMNLYFDAQDDGMLHFCRYKEFRALAEILSQTKQKANELMEDRACFGDDTP